LPAVAAKNLSRPIQTRGIADARAQFFNANPAFADCNAGVDSCKVGKMRAAVLAVSARMFALAAPLNGKSACHKVDR
jgi:hypothetical protein